MFFLVNLNVLVLITLSYGRNYAAVSVATGSAFAAFCLVLVHNCFKKISDIYRERHRSPLSIDSAECEDNSDNEMNAIDEDQTSYVSSQMMYDAKIDSQVDTY